MRSHPRAHSPLYPGLISAALLLPATGCDKAAQAIGESIAEKAQDAAAAGMSEDEKLGQKLNPYIHCINNPSKRMLDAYDRYLSWVDLEKGVTGDERNVYGIYEHKLDATCVDGISKSAETDPDDAELEAAGAEWAKTYGALLPVMDEAHKYYDQEDYKDDKFAKGIELHPKLVAGFDAFIVADKKLREVVAHRNDDLQVRELERMEKEQGRTMPYLTAKVMLDARHLVDVGDVMQVEDLNLEKFEPALKAYEASLDELTKYVAANETEAGSIMMYSTYASATTDYQKAAKELLRRKRDKEPYSSGDKMMLERNPELVDGSPGKFNKKYNDLVSRSNSLGWNMYKGPQ